MINNKDRNFLGVWIPKNIYLNKNLSWSEKILLVEIESLDNEDGCFASNDYFADFLGVTKTTVSISISKLKKLNFVKQVSFDGRKRVLKVVDSEFKKTQSQGLTHSNGSTLENLKHNKTINKTSISLNNRIEKFKNEIYELNFEPHMKSEFFVFWSELNKSKTKMKWEMEKTWDTNLRLNRWKNNQKKWFPKKANSLRNKLNTFNKAQQILNKINKQ
tara:strand:+ start:2096 stop:2746 length:651 start_codon:yes stop_codon:yes gene_type:complete